jgi:hypothetical protein
MRKSIIAAGAFVLAVLATLPQVVRAAGTPARINVYVDCHCEDAVGQKFCATFKDDVDHSDDYRLVANTAGGYGVGVHFASVDLFKGINDPLAGHMSAVAVAFTIYSDRLPAEIFADTSVFRVGQDASGQMSDKILDAVGQIVKLNASVFSNIEATPAAPKPTAAPQPEMTKAPESEP